MTAGHISAGASLTKLDAKGRKIISFLAMNSREPAAIMAKKVLLSRVAVAYRIYNLQEAGVIISYFPLLDLQRLGFREYHVFMLLDERKRDRHAAFEQYLKEHPNTLVVRKYTDTWDIEWVLVAGHINIFDDIMTEMVTRFPDVIFDKEELVTIKGYTSIHLPHYYHTDAGLAPSYVGGEHHETLHKPDAKDMQLLSLLAQNARQSSHELGQKLGMSPDSVIYRIKRMTESGIIKRFTTLINLTKLGYTWYTYAIKFTHFDAKDQAKMTEFVARHPHIIKGMKTLGAWDILLHIVVSNTENYHQTVKDIKNTFADILHSYQTWLAHDEPFFTALPEVVKQEK